MSATPGRSGIDARPGDPCPECGRVIATIVRTIDAPTEYLPCRHGDALSRLPGVRQAPLLTEETAAAVFASTVGRVWVTESPVVVAHGDPDAWWHRDHDVRTADRKFADAYVAGMLGSRWAGRVKLPHGL